MRNGGKHTTTSEGLDKLYGSLSMARVVFRFIGATDALSELKNLSGASGWKEPGVRSCVSLQAISNVWYHVFEHVAWAATVAPEFVRLDADAWWARSDWGWLAFCLIDVYLNVLKARELRKREEGLRIKLRDCSETEAPEILHKLEQIANQKRSLALQNLRMLFYLPNAIHWAYHKPPMPNSFVALMGLAEALVGLRQTTLP
ncbi:unnamed protein product [Discosporangium mesarthrocarpum]